MARRSRNFSVAQFQSLMERIPREIAKELANAVDSEADRVIAVMKSTVPTGIDGRTELLESIRKTPGKHPLRRIIRAGGELTTKDSAAGPYDYSIANEFGTQDMVAQPFFWPSWRLMRPRVRSGIARKARRAIAKVVNLK